MSDSPTPSPSASPTPTPSPSPSHGRRAVAAVAAALLVIVVVGIVAVVHHHSASPASNTSADAAVPSNQPTPSALATSPPTSGGTAQLLATVMANALAQKSVHIQTTDVTPKQRVSFSDDDAVTSGSQHISIDGGTATVRVIGRTTYFTATPGVFQKFFGFPADIASGLDGQWLSLTPGQPAYKTVTTNITLSSSLAQLHLSAPLTRLPAKTLDGVRVFGIEGAISPKKAPSLRATLWVSNDSRELPVEFDSATPTDKSVTTLSRWGEPVIVKVPPNSEPAAAAFTQAPGITT